ncbi:hypothetical protein AgCh_006633 [Apium graveolens]
MMDHFRDIMGYYRFEDFRNPPYDTEVIVVSSGSEQMDDSDCSEDSEDSEDSDSSDDSDDSEDTEDIVPGNNNVEIIHFPDSTSEDESDNEEAMDNELVHVEDDAGNQLPSFTVLLRNSHVNQQCHDRLRVGEFLSD